MEQIEYPESAKLVLLNSAMRCLGIITISEGGLRETSVDVRMVIRRLFLPMLQFFVLLITIHQETPDQVPMMTD